MSWLGLRHKGVEILFPDEWNLVVDGLDLLKQYTDSLSTSLESHASRHNRGGEDPIDYTLIMKLLKKSVSPALGTDGALGSAESVTPDSGYGRIVPLGIKVTVGGSFNSGETVTVRITFHYDDGTSAYIEKSYTATSVDYLTEDDLLSLWKDGVGITKIDVQAGTNLSSTNVTVSVDVRGIQY